MRSKRSSTHPKTLIVIAGPTAVGKTAVAVGIALEKKIHILSADSRQFYRELAIGSAMPSEQELRTVPHHFIGHLSVRDEYNVSRFETDALQCLDEIFSGSDMAILCGGSGLYIDAVCKGMDELPDPDPVIRQRIKTVFQEQGLTALHFELKKLDPEYYSRVDLNNPSRLIRALEVCYITGKTYSSFRKGNNSNRDFIVIKIGLNRPKEELMERIRSRTESMISAGLEEEARNLFPFRHLNSLNTVGYRELFDYFDGKASKEEAITKIITNTWRYAKRQLTWFRRDSEMNWFHPDDLSGIKKLLT